MTERREPYLVRVPDRDVWFIRDGRKRLSTRTADVTKAAEALAAYRAKAHGELARKGKAGLQTLEELLGFWEREHRAKAGGEESWKRKWRFTVGLLNRHAGHKPLPALDFDWSRDYLRARESEGVIGATVRQELTTVLSAWRAAHGRGLVSVEPPLFDLPAPSEPRDVYLTKDEARRLLDACRKPYLRLFVRLGFATGARPGAILALKWSSVDLERGRVDYRTSGQRRVRRGDTTGERSASGKKAAVVPLKPDLIEELREARAVAQTTNVIEVSAKPIASIGRAFKTAVKEAGLDPDEISPHVLRHSAATWMAQAGVPTFQIAGFLGHSSVAMVERVYGHHSPDYMRAGADALDL
jgi:integrase